MLSKYSTYDDLEAVHSQYCDKAIAWYEKAIGGKMAEKQTVTRLSEESVNKHTPLPTRFVLYQPKDADPWLLVTVCYPMPCASYLNQDFVVILYNDGDGMGMFFKVADLQHVSCWINFTSHFFRRFNERFLAPIGKKQKEPLDIIKQYILNISLFPLDISKRYTLPKGEECVWMSHINIGYSPCIKTEEHHNVLVVKTFLTDDMLLPEEREACAYAVQHYSDNIQHWEQQVKQGLAEAFIIRHQEKLTIQNVDRKIFEKYVHETDTQRIHSLYQWLSGLEHVIAYVSNKVVHSGLIWVSNGRIDKFVRDQLYRLVAIEDPLLHLEDCLLPVHAILCHNNLECEPDRLREFFDLVSSTYQQQINQSQLTMNSKQKETLERILRDQKFKGFSTVASTVTKAKTGDVYMNTVEPIFAVSRIIPKINSTSDSEKIQKVQARWIEEVVNNSWCPQLADYERKYGKKLLWKSIEYLINKNQWKSPVGSDNITSKSDDKYNACFGVIDEAADLMLQYYPDMAISEKSVNSAEDATLQETDNVEELPIDVDRLTEKDMETKMKIPSNAEEAMDLAKSLITEATLLNMAGNCLKIYLSDNVKYLEQGDTNKLLKEVNDKDTRISQLQSQVEKWKKNQEESQANYVKKSTECTEWKNKYGELADDMEEMHKKISLLEASLNSANTAIQEKDARIKELEDKNSMPRKRIIAKSELLEIPFIGPAAVNQLKPFLEKRLGAVIDTDK